MNISAPRKPAPRADAIEAFWNWWAADGRAAAEAGIESGEFGDFVEEIAGRVAAIHPDLEWELAPGARADHVLVLSAVGDPELRRRAEQWYRCSPPVTAVWDYHPARLARPLNVIMHFGGHEVNLAELTFDLQVDDDLQVIEALVFHPGFREMRSGASEEVAFLALNWALGEDGVCRWIGDFDASTTPPPAGVPADGLVETVNALAARAGKTLGVQLAGMRDGAIFVATLLMPAKWIDHPLLDHHLAVCLPFGNPTSEGLPTPDSLSRLRELQDVVTSLLPPRSRLVAHETSEGVRTLHLYADSDDLALAEQLRTWVSAWPGASVAASLDPGWRAISHLTG